MARVRNNQGHRSKILNVFMRPYLEQEHTQEKEAFDQARESIKPLQDKTWKLAEKIVRRHYTDADVKMAYHLQNKFQNVDTIAKDSCFHFGYMNKADGDDTKTDGEYNTENRHRDNDDEQDKYITKHFDFRLDGNINGSENSRQNDFAYAYFRDELKGKVNKGEKCNPDINIEQNWGNGSGESNQSNPHWTQIDSANSRELGLSGGRDNQTCYAREWNNDYELDLIGREYCRDRQLNCKEEEFAILMTWQQAKQKLIMAHTKWVETILEQLKVLKGGLRDHVYLEQSIDMAKKMGLTISETDILATTSKGIVVSNQDILNHLASLKNKTQTRDQKIALRKIYDQQQAKIQTLTFQGQSYTIPIMFTSIKKDKKFKIKYTKSDGEEVRRFGIITDDCRGFGNRLKDSRPFLHYYDLDKKGYRYATNWEIL